ncbi:MAG: UDP-4-amino-4,6-dideoxy-N-acetyl-beta-L-altrosamine transaminase [Ignavibacteria bacterium]|nr:UDP-4-amino-4,6-dideoxy-N-acetyl-beta-L-altrosamine transaminase [Ignavibacteria bacterium]
MNKPIPYGKQNITAEDIKAVTDVLQSDFLTQGPRIEEFEKAFAEYIGCKYAVAVANGTAALHLCALALNVKEGDKVITTPITFAASANCVRYCGGEIIFADIDPESYLIDTDNVKKILEREPKGSVKGIIPVDFAGRPVNLEEIKKLADEYGLWIIEDACHAPGGYFTDSKGVQQKCGNGNFAELAIFSFHPVKHIACGEGGMITTNNAELYKKLLVLRTHGITRDKSVFTNSKETACGFLNNEESAADYPGWYMEMQELGYNYRLTDFQAALGTSQLKRADEGLARRRDIASNYYDAFKNSEFIKGQSGVVEGHGYHLYVIEVKNRLGLYNYLREKNIFAQIHYIPAHMMPYYQKFGWKPGDMPDAENYYSMCLSLPMYPTLTNEEQEYVVKCIKDFFNK